MLETYKNTYLDFIQTQKKLKNLQENLENNNREVELLTFQLHELDDAAIKQGEEEELKKEADVLSNVQELKEGTYSSYWALYGDNQSIVVMGIKKDLLQLEKGTEFLRFPQICIRKRIPQLVVS